MSRTRRRQFIVAAGALLVSPIARAQADKVHRIGFLSSESASAWSDRVEALRAGLRELGYAEGRNIAIEFRWAEGKLERLPALAAELTRLNPALIVAGAAPASRAAKQATTTIPIVMVAVGDAVEFGLVSSLARPGGNLTGSSFFSIELTAKRIELLKEATPRIRRIGALVNPGNPGDGSVRRAMEAAAQAMKLALQFHEVRRGDEYPSAFSAMAKAEVEAVAIPQQPIHNVNARQIADLAARHKLASIGGVEFADAGCLLGYGASFPELYRSAAAFVDKILKGARPGDLPIERATKFELVVNLKTAKALGLTIPPSILLRADRVIE
jgi:putative ABC transport system substrate-binding protein